MGILQSVTTARHELEQVGREIYYAISHLPERHPARANLNMALRHLGIDKPSDVGLSSSILRRKAERVYSRN